MEYSLPVCTLPMGHGVEVCILSTHKVDMDKDNFECETLKTLTVKVHHGHSWESNAVIVVVVKENVPCCVLTGVCHMTLGSTHCHYALSL